MILRSMLRVSPLKGLWQMPGWQVPGWWSSSGKGLMGLMHIDELGGRVRFTL